MILAGDIGGTKTILRLYHHHSGKLQLEKEVKFESRKYLRFEDILPEFFGKGGAPKVESVCLGVAGPVQEGRSKTTNLPWVLEETRISDYFGIHQVKLLNDLEAAAFGVLFLSPDEKEILNLGHNGVKKGNVSVIAAGTGLGEAFLHWDGEGFRPIPSEGGHSDFAPQGETQVALYHFLSSEFGHVSYERILSGPGIFNIYRFLRDTGQINESKWIRDKLKEGDPSATIT